MGVAAANGKANLGTAPVFLTSISTILGAILFLRFGYAVGHVGFFGVALVILIGHLVTIPTAMAVSEIATNQKVEGGGEYYIISRSFGFITGGAIGVALYLARAISVAFYVIAFAEAFGPILHWLQETQGLPMLDKRLVSVPAFLGLTVLMLGRGADLGLKALYFVVGVLFVSLALFFLGKTDYVPPQGIHALTATIPEPDPLFLVFAICFPAFTGMAAGVGLSGDLRDPKRAIPLGTMAATFTGMAIYVLVAYKLAVSASPQDLASDQLVMSRIAVWGPIIPIGLAAATLSSALGSYLVAPRTLQAIAGDRILPARRMNAWLFRGTGPTQEPRNATLVTAAVGILFVVIGDVDFVAQIISMFFMFTYGAICTISFLEHFAADPSYRPGFRSRWYVSFFGAVMSVWLMFQMSFFYAVLSLFLMFVLYLTISHYNRDRGGLSNIVQGAVFQISRQLRVFLQKSRKIGTDSWRPAVVCISRSSFERLTAFDLLRWISHRYGFGTYVHHIEGYLSRTSAEDAATAHEHLVALAGASRSNVYVDTMISPSYTTAICQIIQLPGISGKDNNMVLFEFEKGTRDDLDDIVDNYQLVASLGFDVCILGTSSRGFGYCRQIHAWLTPDDDANDSLMVVLAYILLGHPDWRKAVIKVFSIVPESRLEEDRETLHHLIRSGRLPIAAKNVEFIPQVVGTDRRSIIAERSSDADLVIVGFRGEALKRRKAELFAGYEGVGNILFVNARQEIEIDREAMEEPPAAAGAVES